MIKQTEDKIKVEKKYQKGDLPFVLFYQSLNGLPCFEHHGTLKDINERVARLEFLGRHPIIFLKVSE